MTDPTPPNEGVPWNRQYVIAVGLLLAFGVFVGMMVVLADRSDDQVWQRRIYLFSAVEAIVFTAVGWLFGREVHRSAAESARQDATEARQSADAARDEAQRRTAEAAAAEQRAVAERIRGETIAAVIEHSQVPAAGDGPRPAGRSPQAGDGYGGTPEATAAVVDLRALVRDLYRT